MTKIPCSAVFILCVMLLEESCSWALSLQRRRHIQNCAKCPPGWGVRKLCSAHKNTECKRCIPGKTYSSHYSRYGRCWQCSRCGIGLYEAHKCSTIGDTICDDCTRIMYKPDLRRNKDFRDKCGYLFLNESITDDSG